jgi:diaminopimelate epimerase
MGLARVLADRPVVAAASLPAFGEAAVPPMSGTAIEMPNPHVVVFLPDAEQLAVLDLSRPPTVEPARADGQNVEFVVRRGPRRLRMRVHERGVGETRSCGTGICAAAVAAAAADGSGADGTRWRVDVPGGSCAVVWRTDGEVELTGPAVLVAQIDVAEEWLRR